MLVEDLFEQEEGFPQTWGPQEGLVDFVGGVPLVVAADDASFLGEAAAAQRYDLAGAAFLPHLITKKSSSTVSVDALELFGAAEREAPPTEQPTEQPTAEDLARYLPVVKPTADVAFAASSSNHSLLDGADLALDFAAFDAQAAVYHPPASQSEQDEQEAASPASAGAQDDCADGSSRDEQRKQRNRESAARSRKRTRERMAYLENLVDHLMKKNRRLEAAVQQLSRAAPAYAPAPPGMMGAPAAVARGPDDLFQQLAC